MIYYTFNGEQYTIAKDVKYIIELPNVLDNEFLDINVQRLDYIEPPVEIWIAPATGEPYIKEVGGYGA